MGNAKIYGYFNLNVEFWFKEDAKQKRKGDMEVHPLCSVLGPMVGKELTNFLKLYDRVVQGSREVSH